MISPMKVIRLLIGILIYWNSSVAQFVRLENQQFKIGNDNFFPMCMNYTIEDVKNGNSFFPAPCHSYGNNNMNFPDILECDNLTDCKQQLQQHFNYIAGMGFNVIRLCELSPKIKIHISPINNLEAYSINHEYVDISSSTDFVDIIQIPQISESEQGIQILFSELDIILQCAANAVIPSTGVSHPMKIILLNEYTSLLTDNEVSFRAAYLKVLSKHIRNSPFRNSFFAHDLMNEPAPNLKPRKTKQKACEIIDSWYTAIKGEDPTQLVTLGTGIDDVFSFDPAIIHVDFLSLHVYPNWDRESDNHYDPAAQQRMRTRMVNDIYYFDKICPKPWIIGETGFKADDYSSFSSPPTPPPPGQVPTIPSAIPTTTSLTKMGYDGSLIDLGKFVNNSLYDACNCGAKGYSWWWFQETTFGDMAGDSYGLLRLNWDPNNTNYGSSIEKQPAVNNFRSFANAMPSNNNLPIFGGICGTDYTNSYNSSVLYYNQYLSNPNLNYSLMGSIIDNNGSSLEDALIFMNSAFSIPNIYYDPSIIGSKPTMEKDIYVFTKTDKLGTFKVSVNPPSNALQNSPVYPYNSLMNSIFNFKVSAPMAKYFEVYHWGGNNQNIIVPAQIILDKFTNNSTLSNQSFNGNSQIIFKGGEVLTLNNFTLQGTGYYDFTASSEIQINSEFLSNSETHIYLSTTESICNQFQDENYNEIISKKRFECTASSSNKVKRKKIDLKFKTPKRNNNLIYPNPADKILHIDLDENAIYELQIVQMDGSIVYQEKRTNSNNSLDVGFLAKGTYIVYIKNENIFFNKKLVIQ